VGACAQCTAVLVTIKTMFNRLTGTLRRTSGRLNVIRRGVPEA
jgi:hypothetical protein